MNKYNKYKQLELPLYESFKVGQKVKIKELDSTGNWDFRGQIAKIFSISKEGYFVKIPRHNKNLKFILVKYSFWEIEPL